MLFCNLHIGDEALRNKIVRSCALCYYPYWTRNTHKDVARTVVYSHNTFLLGEYHENSMHTLARWHIPSPHYGRQVIYYAQHHVTAAWFMMVFTPAPLLGKAGSDHIHDLIFRRFNLLN